MQKVISVILFFLIAYHVSSQANIIQGQWKGTLVRENKEWTTELNFYVNGKELTGYFDLPDYGLYHLAFDSIQINGSIIRCEFKDKNSTAIFDGDIQDKIITGEWEGLGITASFTLKKISNTAIQFNIENVSFSNEDAVLAGTLIAPCGKGPFPAIVQVHGSGNQTRAEDFYNSRAYLFARNGIAVLIYDRRGKGASTGSVVSMELLADDAIAGIHFLQHHASINKNKIGIMGFSQGGYVGPLAVSRSSDIAFIIAGSAPGITPDEQNDFDVENELRNKKVSEDSIKYVLSFRKELRNYQYNNFGNKEELENRLSALRTMPWFKNTLLEGSEVDPVSMGVEEWLAFDPLPVWEKVKVPKLLIWGELDNVVPAMKSKELIEASLNKTGYNNYQMKIYENANHGIAIVNNGKEWDWPRLAEEYQQVMVDWVKEITK